MATNKDTGTQGEKSAISYLQNCGYEILDVNWRFKRLEVDIVAMDQQVLVFVEVKTRRSVDFGHPSSFVDDKKQSNLVQLADRYIVEHKHEYEVRFDIVSIIQRDGKEEIEHIKDAFWPY